MLQGQSCSSKPSAPPATPQLHFTAEPPFPRLTSRHISGQRIWPYTDLLLHDMGPGLADGRPDFLANGQQEDATAVGIGLFKDVNGHQRLLHDGRARVLEAVVARRRSPRFP
ncbi:MAG: di-heme oxidoredictase family protein [Burkholderiaceae bacterium]